MAHHPSTRPDSLQALGGGRPGLSIIGSSLALTLFLFACAKPEGEQAEKATPEDYCRSRGFDVGSAEYGRCVEHQKQLGVVRFFSRDQMVRPR